MKSITATLLAVLLAEGILWAELPRIPEELAPGLVGGLSGTTITVNTDGEAVEHDGFCSLREAVMASTSNMATDSCPPGSNLGTDTILLSPNEIYQLDRRRGSLNLGGLLRIVVRNEGRAAVDATGSAPRDQSPIFVVNPGATVTLKGLSIRGGHNAAGNGGGIVNRGRLTVVDSTISHNRSDAGGGGIANENEGVMTLTNVTVSANRATRGGGIFMNGGLAASILTNVTISQNSSTEPGGGISQLAGTVSLKNTLIADNESLAGSNHDCLGTLHSLGNNLIHRADCTVNGTLDSNITGQDARIGSLGNNGGGLWTHALQLEPVRSPALDRGAGCPPADSRGVPRPPDVCDIGAYEAAPPVSLSLNPLRFPDTRFGQVANLSVRLVNTGAERIVVTGIAVDGVPFGLRDWSGCDARPLAPAQSCPFTISFSPAGSSVAAQDFTGRLTVQFTSGGPVSPYGFPIFGRGTPNTGARADVDMTPPIVTIVSPANEGTTPDTFTMNVTTDENAACNFRVDGGPNTRMTTTGATSHTHALSGLSAGRHTVNVTCADASPAGHMTAASSTWTVATSSGGGPGSDPGGEIGPGEPGGGSTSDITDMSSGAGATGTSPDSTSEARADNGGCACTLCHQSDKGKIGVSR